MALKLIIQNVKTNGVSRTGRPTSEDLEMKLIDTENRKFTHYQAKTFIPKNIPLSRDILRLESFDFENESGSAYRSFIINAHYTQPPIEQSKSKAAEQKEKKKAFVLPPPFISGFRVGTESRHITNAEEEKTASKTLVKGKKAPDFNGAIGFNGETFDGLDIVVPTIEFDVTRSMFATDIDAQFIHDLAFVTGRVNDGPFFLFKRGEVLGMGADVSISVDDDVAEVHYSFAVQLNTGNKGVNNPLKIAGQSVNKFGWDYFWVYNEKKVEKDFVIGKPRALYGVRPYQWTSFQNKLGFG